jgi:hypothetical protein
MDRVFGFIAENPMAAVVVGGEIAFRVFIIVGLAHRFAGGPAPEKRKKTGHEKYRAQWRSWGKCVFACVIAGRRPAGTRLSHRRPRAEQAAARLAARARSSHRGLVRDRPPLPI